MLALSGPLRRLRLKPPSGALSGPLGCLAALWDPQWPSWALSGPLSLSAVFLGAHRPSGTFREGAHINKSENSIHLIQSHPLPREKASLMYLFFPFGALSGSLGHLGAL